MTVVFYRLGALSVPQPTVSKHWRELKELTQPEKIAHWPWSTDSWKGTLNFLYTACLTPILSSLI